LLLVAPASLAAIDKLRAARFTPRGDLLKGLVATVTYCKSHTGVAGKLFEALANAGVEVDMISTSEIKISVVIDLARGEQAMKAVHAAFIA